VAPPALTPDAFAGDAIYAYADPADDLRWTLSVARGRDAIAAALDGRGEETVEVLAAVERDRDWFAEGWLVAGGEPATAFLALQRDDSGAIARALSLRCAAIDPPPGGGRDPGGAWPDARPILETYLGHLRAARFEEAAACFAPDCLYTHPPFPGGAQRVLYRDREAAHRGFVQDRGPTPAIQVISLFVQDGPTAFVEGVVDGIPNGGTWGSTLTLAPDGVIQRYVAFYGAPRVERLTAPANASNASR
jgi:hypothetical protein